MSVLFRARNILKAGCAFKRRYLFYGHGVTTIAFVGRMFMACLTMSSIFGFYAANGQARQSQVFEFKNLTVDNGLSDRGVKCILKDSRGFMWFGTANGLNRYDGVEFRIFKHEFNNPASLCNNSITTLFMDANQNIWVGTQNGLSVFNPKTEEFFSYYNNAADPNSLGGVSVSKVIEDHKRNIWIATSNGFDLFIAASKTFKHFRNDPQDSNSLINNAVTDIEMDAEENLWIATREGVDLFNIGLNNFTHFKEKFGGSFLARHATKLHLDEDGNLWLGTLENGLHRFNKQKFRFERIMWDVPTTSLKDLQILSIKHDHTGKLYVGTTTGLMVSDSLKNHFKGYASNEGKIGNIIGTSVPSIYCDHRAHMLWIGTDIGGVVYASIQSKPFKLYKVESEGNARKTVTSIAEDNDSNIWIATRGSGVKVINKRTGKVRKYIIDTRNGTGLLTNEVIAVEKDNTGNMWFGTYLGGLDLFDTKSEKFIHFTQDLNNSSTLNGINVYDIQVDSLNNIWVATDKSMNLYHRENGTFTNYQPIITDPDNERNNIIRQILDGRNGNLLIVTFKSIQIFNIKLHTFSRFFEQMEKGIDMIQYLLVDSKGNFWIGTNNGLFWVNKDKATHKIFSEKEGFPSNFITSLLEDDDGNLWIATRGNGLLKFENGIHNQQNPHFTIFSEDDGLQGKEFEVRAAYKGKDNTLCFGGEEGVNVFNPKDVSENRNAPPVVITKLRIFSKDIEISKNSPLTNAISETETLTLSYADYVFSLNFAALNYMHSERNQYSYMLENFDKEWNFVKNNHTATYTNLNPGVYTFRVKASNNYGVWNEAGTSLKIVITPPYWKTWWFIILVTTTFAASIYAFIRMKVSSIKRQKQELEKQVVERTSEIFEQNEKLMIQKEKLMVQAENLRKANSEIKDSIRAAQTIQQSILPSEKFIKKILPESFILYKPKDVVSGDFYWFDLREDTIIIAAVDCTGHGVSGAFMSISGYHILNECIHSHKELIASEILDRLNEGVIKELNSHTDSQVEHGMDIALCIIDKERKTLQYAGANNPLYILRKSEIIQIKADKFPIGLLPKGKVNKFVNNELEVRTGDVIYIFSDGYADQIGGTDGNEKFKYPKFRELLIKIGSEDMEKQLSLLDNNLANWRGSSEQLDDVLVIGFKI